MYTLAFTASRTGFEPPPERLLDVLLSLPVADRYVTGAAIGGDAFLGQWLRLTFPGAQHAVVVPADKRQVYDWWSAMPGLPVQVIQMPQWSSYRDRNIYLVQLAREVFGFPAWPEDDNRSKRSGTWQTIRLARAAGKMASWHCVLEDREGRG